VGVEVRRADARREDLADLRGKLVVGPDFAAREGGEQARDARREWLSGHQRLSPDQDQMAADIERGDFTRPAERVVEGGAVGHQGGGGEDAAAVGLDDAFVHVRGKAEIVGVDDQLFAGGQKIVSLMVRNFLGLARMSLASDWNSRVAPFIASYNCGFTTNCPRLPCPALMRSTVLFILASSSSSRLCS